MEVVKVKLPPGHDHDSRHQESHTAHAGIDCAMASVEREAMIAIVRNCILNVFSMVVPGMQS